MAMCANSQKMAKGECPPMKVAKEYMHADQKSGMLRKAMKGPKGGMK